MQAKHSTGARQLALALALVCGVFIASARVATAQHMEAVLFDEGTGDGVWARGSDYKAHFGSEGVTFVPFLGSQAPHNYPLGLAVREARLGAMALELREVVEPARDGALVTYDRGGFSELFQVEPGSVEQIFHFDELPASGDLVLRLEIETELSAHESGGGISFLGDLGGVHYGEVTAFDDRGELLRTSPALVGGALEIRVPREHLARARGPLVIDPLITTFVIESSAADDRDPDVAYDSSLDLYAVVWKRVFSQSDSDAHGRLLDASGATVLDFLIDVTAGNANAPVIAGIDALDQFLAVYRTGTDSGDVLGRVLDLSGGSLVIGSPSTILGSATRHAVGGDAGTEPPFHYLVASQWVWLAFLDYRFVAPDGQIGPLHSFHSEFEHDYRNPRLGDAVEGAPGQPRRWPMAFEFYLYSSTVSLQATLLQSDGSHTPWTTVVGATDSPRLAGVSSMLEGAAGDLPYLVTWITGGGTGDVQARLMRGTSTSGGIQTVHAGSTGSATVESDGSSFVVSFTDTATPGVSESVRIASYDLSGDSVELTEEVEVAHVNGVARGPALVSTRQARGAHQRLLAVWYELAGSGGDLVAALYDTPGPGVPDCISAPNSVGPGARLRAAGSISLTSGTFELIVEGCPANTPGTFYLGLNPIQLPFGEGFRCIGDPTARIFPILTADAQGTASLTLDFSQDYGALVSPSPGEVSYQFWYRDPAGGPSGFNFSDALRVQHTP